jgi:hypothetical protein
MTWLTAWDLAAADRSEVGDGHHGRKDRGPLDIPVSPPP